MQTPKIIIRLQIGLIIALFSKYFPYKNFAMVYHFSRSHLIIYKHKENFCKL